MNKLWRNNISKNLELILHPDIVMDYNVDGTHGKQRLKDFKKCYGVLIGNYSLKLLIVLSLTIPLKLFTDSIASLSSACNKDPEQLLRQAMQLNKKKHFRQQAIQKKSSTPMDL